MLQVVPSIILSVISAVLGMVQLFLMGTADVLEPGVNALLALTETSKDTVRDCSFFSKVVPSLLLIHILRRDLDCPAYMLLLHARAGC